MENGQPSLIVALSPINGRGVYATRDFAPHEVVLRWSCDVSWAIFLNHSCDPSCYTEESSQHGWHGDVLYAGPAGLRKDQEVTFDYKITRWQNLWAKTVHGQCGCRKCR